MGQLSPRKPFRMEAALSCHNRLEAKSPVEGQASSAGAVNRKDMPLAVADPAMGHRAWVSSETLCSVPRTKGHHQSPLSGEQ